MGMPSWPQDNLHPWRAMHLHLPGFLLSDGVEPQGGTGGTDGIWVWARIGPTNLSLESIRHVCNLSMLCPTPSSILALKGVKACPSGC